MNDCRDWTHIPSPEPINSYQDCGNLPPELLRVLPDIIQDGLCIVNREMEVMYSNLAMRYWYGECRTGDSKCYAQFHRRTEPCIDCPARKAFVQGTPQTGMQIMEAKGKITGRQQLYCVPIVNAAGEAFLVVEYVRDITDEKMAESSLQLLEKQNAVLQDNLRRSYEENRRTQEETDKKISYIVSAIKQSLSALLDQKNYQRMERQIDRLLDTFENRQSSLAFRLSDQEKAVAKYIVEGYVSKEIAEKLRVSKKTVDYHRTNIRKKLGLGPNDSLRKRLEEELY